MVKLHMPEDRAVILELILEKMQTVKCLYIPKSGESDPVSHQLNLQGLIDSPSVRMGVNELIGAGEIVVSEPESVGTQSGDPRLTSGILYGSLAV